MIKIGAINIDTSHPKAFTEIINAGERARYTEVYNAGFRGDDEVEGFMKYRGIAQRSQSVDELAERVDVGFVHGCNWDKHVMYIEPFFKRGKPVFIDKPLCGSMADIAKVREYAKNGAKILGCSCMRYASAVADFAKLPVEERGEIVSVHSSCGVDEFNYAIHAVEAIGALLNGAVSCQFVSGGDVGGVRGETYCIRYASGASATYSLTYGRWQPSMVTVMTNKNTYQLKPAGYDDMLERVLTSVETGVAQTASIEELIESILIMLAGKLSRENGGAVVKLSEIPADYEGFDGDAFEAFYADSNKDRKMYL